MTPDRPRPRDEEIDVHGLTHTGRVRDENQDHFLVCSLNHAVRVHRTSLPDPESLGSATPLGEGVQESSPGGAPQPAGPAGAEERLAFLAMVADGVGGGPGGEKASRLAVEGVTRYVTESLRTYYTADPGAEVDFSRALQEAALRCHRELVGRGGSEAARARMATTLTLWLGVWPRAYLLQVGDSRYYLYRDGDLTQVSRDQTIAQELVDQGVLSRPDQGNPRWANILSSAIGGEVSRPVVTGIEQDWGQVHLLCSDGLTKHVPDDRIAERLRTMTSARQVCNDLLEDALDGGGSDNVTVIVGRTVGEE